MDPELKSLMTDLRAKMGEVDKVKGAVLQLEEQMKGLPATIENKVKAIRSVAWDGRGNYRGVFDTEGDARCFGAFVMHHVGGNSKAGEMLAGELKGVLERAHAGSPTSSGGAVVPVEYARRVQRLVESFGVFAANAFPMPMSSDSLTF